MTDDDGDSLGGLIRIGKIVGAHGLKGALKVYSYAESSSIFEPQRQVFIKDSKQDLRPFRIISAQPHGKVVLMTLDDVDDRRQAEALIDAELLIDKTSLPVLEADTYYWFDLIGLSVYTTDGGYLGRLESIIQTGSNDVYVVQDPQRNDKKEWLIPAIDTVVVDIDLQRHIMRVVLPEEL